MISTNRHPIMLPSGYTFHMIEVEEGNVTMGNEDDNTVCEVKVPSFWIAEYPTTQKLWFEVIGGNNPSYFQGDLRPVEQVSWYEAAAFCNVLNALFNYKAKYFVDENHTHLLDIKIARASVYPNVIPIFMDTGTDGFRLPKEKEWAYAAKGGNESKGLRYAGSNLLDEVGWYLGNSHLQTHPVGLKYPNELGIYDMSGNVGEWCEDQKKMADWLGQYKSALRGGSWNHYMQQCENSAFDSHHVPSSSDTIGFRIALHISHGDWPKLKSNSA